MEVKQEVRLDKGVSLKTRLIFMWQDFFKFINQKKKKCQ